MQSTTNGFPKIRPEAMTDSELLAWLNKIMADYRLSLPDLARYTGYSYSAVASWFTSADSARHRPVPLRAVERLLLELKAGNVRGSN